MKLKEWMEKHRVSNQDLGTIIGHHRTTVSKFRTGIRIPKLIDAIKIEEATKGAVPVESFRPTKKKKK